jgi:hypothetical protein
LGLVILDEIDSINILIPLTMIPLSGTHCITLLKLLFFLKKWKILATNNSVLTIITALTKFKLTQKAEMHFDAKLKN